MNIPRKRLIRKTVSRLQQERTCAILDTVPYGKHQAYAQNSRQEVHYGSGNPERGRKDGKGSRSDH